MSGVSEVVSGSVSAIMSFGAFVSLEDGSTGLVHISEISKNFVKDVNEFLTIGQQVRVVVLATDHDCKKRLSMKKADEILIANGDSKWVLIPIGLLIGAVLIFAEPAVHVLNKQVEDITGGVIRRKAMMIGISIGVAVAMLLVIIRALVGFDFMFIIAPLVLILVILLPILCTMQRICIWMTSWLLNLLYPKV